MEDRDWCFFWSHLSVSGSWRRRTYSSGYLGQHAKVQNHMIIPSGRKLKFTPKYIVVGGEGGYQKLFKVCNLILLVSEGRMQNFITLEKNLLGET